MNKEQLQALVSLTPDGWQIKFEVKGEPGASSVDYIHFDNSKKRVTVRLSDGINRS
jgi:hypothetical protein